MTDRSQETHSSRPAPSVRAALGRAFVAGLALLAVVSCVTPLATPLPDPVALPHVPSVAVLSAESERRLVFVAIDGVRWQELAYGVDPVLAGRAGMDPALLGDGASLAPNLFALARRGFVAGLDDRAPMIASGPAFVSLPGYTEMFTGAVGTCAGNGCAGALEPTWLDVARAAFGPREVAVVSSWEKLCRAASLEQRVSSSCGRGPASFEEGVLADPRVAAALDAGRRAPPGPGEPTYRPDALTADLAVELLRASRPRVLAVGLGDTDEHAHLGDYPGYLAALRSADETVGRLVAVAAGLPGETLVVVTTDHGREAGFRNHGAFAPESSRVFAVGASVRAGEAAAGGQLARRPRRLADLADLASSWLRVPERTARLFPDPSPRAPHG